MKCSISSHCLLFFFFFFGALLSITLCIIFCCCCFVLYFARHSNNKNNKFHLNLIRNPNTRQQSITSGCFLDVFGCEARILYTITCHSLDIFHFNFECQVLELNGKYNPHLLCLWIWLWPLFVIGTWNDFYSNLSRCLLKDSISIEFKNISFFFWSLVVLYSVQSADNI